MCFVLFIGCYLCYIILKDNGEMGDYILRVFLIIKIYFGIMSVLE